MFLNAEAVEGENTGWNSDEIDNSITTAQLARGKMIANDDELLLLLG